MQTTSFSDVFKKERLLIFGDAHIGKKFYLEPSKFSHEWEKRLVRFIVSTIDHYAPAKVIFLGDTVDTTSKRNTKIVDELVSLFPATDFLFVLGNHDLGLKLSSKNAFLIRNPCHITREIFCWPYAGRYPQISAWGPYFGDAKVILSHNNVYYQDVWYGIPMWTIDQIKKFLRKDAVIINGHIHRYHVEPNYVQLGTVTAMAFRQDQVGFGTLLIQDGKFQPIPNETVRFIAYSKDCPIDTLEAILHEAKDKDQLIALKTSVEIPKRLLRLVDGVQYGRTEEAGRKKGRRR